MLAEIDTLAGLLASSSQSGVFARLRTRHPQLGSSLRNSSFIPEPCSTATMKPCEQRRRILSPANRKGHAWAPQARRRDVSDELPCLPARRLNAGFQFLKGYQTAISLGTTLTFFQVPMKPVNFKTPQNRLSNNYPQLSDTQFGKPATCEHYRPSCCRSFGFKAFEVWVGYYAQGLLAGFLCAPCIRWPASKSRSGNQVCSC